MIRVGFIYSDSGTWTGGPNYMKNLLHAAIATGGEIAPVLIVPPALPNTALAGFPDVEVLRTDVMYPSFSRRAREMVQRIVGFDPIKAAFLRRNDIAVLSHSGHLGARGVVPTIGWIPDFQHRRMPQFFQPEEIRSRDKEFRRLCDFCATLIVSSEDAQNNLADFEPAAIAKSRVLRFVSGFCGVQQTLALPQLRARYSFTRPYFFLPNQFWTHKNHRVVVEALALLKARGTPVLVLCTGHNDDRRQPGHFAELMAHVNAKGVEDDFRVLGLVPYGDLSALMRHALAIINPSLFEGWSTTVEEAKSLGKAVILSDIPVHREQAPERGHYFRPDAPVELADALLRVAEGWRLEEEERLQRWAQAALQDRFVAFAHVYHSIIYDTLEKYSLR